MSGSIDSVLAEVVGMTLKKVEPAKGRIMNNHDPYVLTFEHKGESIRVGLDGDCYGTIRAEILKSGEC